MVSDFFTQINSRLGYLETAVISKLEKHPDVNSLQEEITNFLREVEEWDSRHSRAGDQLTHDLMHKLHTNILLMHPTYAKHID